MKMKVTFKNGEHMILTEKEIDRIFNEEDLNQLSIEPIKYVRKTTIRDTNAAFKSLVGAIDAKFSDTYEDYLSDIRNKEGQL